MTVQQQEQQRDADGCLRTDASCRAPFASKLGHPDSVGTKGQIAQAAGGAKKRLYLVH